MRSWSLSLAVALVFGVANVAFSDEGSLVNAATSDSADTMDESFDSVLAEAMEMAEVSPSAVDPNTAPAADEAVVAEGSEAAAAFDEGHYQQIEVAGLLKNSSQKELARRFLGFMISDTFQRIIPTTNWMYPAALAQASLPPEFSQLIDPSPALLFDDKLVAAQRKTWVDEWLEVMSR